MQSDQGLNSLLTELLGITEYINGEQRPGWYFAQDDLNLRILCIFTGTLSLDLAYMMIWYFTFLSTETISYILLLLFRDLTLIMLIKLRWHSPFQFSANQITWSRLLIKIHILNGKQCRSRSFGFFRSQLIWIYTVSKGRLYPGSAWLELISLSTIFQFMLSQLPNGWRKKRSGQIRKNNDLPSNEKEPSCQKPIRAEVSAGEYTTLPSTHKQSNFNVSNTFGQWKFVLDMGNSRHWGLVIELGHVYNLGMSFPSYIK